MDKLSIERMDVVSRKKYKRRNLIRISFNKQTKQLNPLDSYSNSKGVYVLKDKQTICELQKRKILNKIFKINLDDKFYFELLRKVEENE